MDKLNSLPFFARFLEPQELEQIQGGLFQTMKYPSDSDETTKRSDTVETMKYPSDSDEIGTNV